MALSSIDAQNLVHRCTKFGSSLMIPLRLNSFFALESKRTNLSSVFRVRCSNSDPDLSVRTENLPNDVSLTGGAYDFGRATKTLTQKSISAPKKVTLVRHGLSSWNDEGRVQGSSNFSVLTETGVRQAERCRKALKNINFDRCFSSPISRAKTSAEVLWQGRDEPLVFLDSLKEAHLFHLEGRKCFGCISQIDIEGSALHFLARSREEGEAMLQSLNMTAHMYNDDVYL